MHSPHAPLLSEGDDGFFCFLQTDPTGKKAHHVPTAPKRIMCHLSTER